MLRGLRSLLHLLNPLVFVLALAGLLAIARRSWRGEGSGAAMLTALAFVYVTAIHNVFQAEPRYAIAYRPEELLLAFAALAALAEAWRRRRGLAGTPEPA